MKGKRFFAAMLIVCVLASLVYIAPVPTQAANTHTIVLSSTQNSDGSYSHSVLYDGQAVTEYDYTWHADPSTVHDEVKNSPAEYYTGTQPGNEAVYIAHDIYYYPELDTSRFTKMNYDGEQEWVYYYTATGYTDYIFSTLPGRSGLPTDMMHSAEDAYQNAVLHITQPGTYNIQGTWHGQIWVDLENYCDDPFTDPTAKVELILGGVDITCTVAAGVRTYTCTLCGNSYTEEIAATGHSYVDGTCTVCGESDTDYVPVYYLVGYINGANYGCEGDWENLGIYKFVDGQLTATFQQDSYVFVKTGDNNNWYLANAYCTDTTCNLVIGGNEKMLVPGGVTVTFTLVSNGDAIGSATAVYGYYAKAYFAG